MVATLVQAKEALGGNIDTLTFDAPPTAGNLLVARVGARSSGHATTDIGAGWTSAAHAVDATTVTHLVYRVADGTSADDGPGLTNVGGSTRAARIEEWSGVDVSSNPLDVIAENAGSSDPIQSGTTPASAAPVIAFVAAADRNRLTFDGGWDNGFTTDWIGDTVAGGANREASTSTQFQTSPTYSGSVDWSVVLAVFLVEDAVSPHVFFDLTDLPADFGNAETAEVVVRTRGVDIGATPLKLFAQIFESDEATPLTDEVLCREETADSAFANFTVPFTGVEPLAAKTVWDNARVRFRWGSTADAPLNTSEFTTEFSKEFTSYG